MLEKLKDEAATTCGGDWKLGILRSDNGGEYLSGEFEDYLKSKGVHHERTVLYSPEQNRVAERMNRTLVESARTVIAHASLPDCYWAEAVAAAAYVCNRTLTRAFKESIIPYEKWYGRKPDVSHLRVFGCIAYANVPDALRQKLDKKAERFRFVGYSKVSKGYRLFNEKSKKVVVRRDVRFDETDFGAKADGESGEKKEVIEIGADCEAVTQKKKEICCRASILTANCKSQANCPVWNR